MNSDKILVTGGGGFLGLEIVKLLIERGHDVTSLSRGRYDTLVQLRVEQIQCDLSSHESIEQLDLSPYSAIFHVAAKAGVWGRKSDFFSINYTGTKNLIDKAKSCGIKFFVYTSTPSVVFDSKDIINGDEDLPYAKSFKTFYAESKMYAEKYFINSLNSDFFGVALRPHLIWGPGDPHIIPRLLAKAKAKKLKCVGDKNNLVDIIYVENAARAHVDAFEKLITNHNLSGNAYFIGQENPVYLWDFINKVLKLNGVQEVKTKIPFKLAYFIGYICEQIYKLFNIYKVDPPMTRFVAMQLAKSHYFSHAKASKDFGYKAYVSTEDGLTKTFKNL